VTIVVNVSDARVSKDPTDTIATYSLGSCIGVALYDPVCKAGGMLHYQLPNASIDAQRAAQNPFMFADTGMDALLDMLSKVGASKHRLKVKIAGAAQMLNDAGLFSIGRRNHSAIRKILWQKGLMLEAEAIGGTSPRSIYLNIADGTLTLKADGQTSAL